MVEAAEGDGMSKERNRPPVRRDESLFGQALLNDRSAGRLPYSQEGLRAMPKVDKNIRKLLGEDIEERSAGCGRL